MRRKAGLFQTETTACAGAPRGEVVRGPQKSEHGAGTKRCRGAGVETDSKVTQDA